MTEQSNEDSSSNPQQADLDIVAVLRRMQQQLAFLEKKIDTLIKQSPERSGSQRPFNRDRGFQRSFRPGGGFGHSDRHPRGERSSHSQDRPERSFAPRRHFDNPHSSDQAPRSFDQRKKRPFRPRSDRDSR